MASQDLWRNKHQDLGILSKNLGSGEIRKITKEATHNLFPINGRSWAMAKGKVRRRWRDPSRNMAEVDECWWGMGGTHVVHRVKKTHFLRRHIRSFPTNGTFDRTLQHLTQVSRFYIGSDNSRSKIVNSNERYCLDQSISPKPRNTNLESWNYQLITPHQYLEKWVIPLPVFQAQRKKKTPDSTLEWKGQQPIKHEPVTAFRAAKHCEPCISPSILLPKFFLSSLTGATGLGDGQSFETFFLLFFSSS